MIGVKPRQFGSILCGSRDQGHEFVCAACRVSTCLMIGAIHFLIHTTGLHVICITMDHGPEAKCLSKGVMRSV